MDECIHSTRSDPFVIREDDMLKYAAALLRIADLVKSETPDVLYCPLRGAYPVLRAIEPLVKDYVKDIMMVPASEFLTEKEPIVYSSFADIMSRYTAPRILVTDTVITGSSIRRFRTLARDCLKKITGVSNKPVELTIVKLWQNKEFNNPNNGGYRSENVLIKDYNFGTGYLFCEDKPDLLGIDYPYESGDKKFPFVQTVNCRVPIFITGRGKAHQYKADPTTAETCLNLVHEYMERMQDRRGMLFPEE